MDKRKEWEPDTTKGYTNRYMNGNLSHDVSVYRVSNKLGCDDKVIPVRIIRESDYQNLLRLASKKAEVM